MSYRLKDRNRTPPKGFQWVDPQTTYLVEARNYMAWRNNAIEHATANGLPVPTEEEMEDQLCGRYSPEIRRQVCDQIENGLMEPILGVGGTLKRMLARLGIHSCWGCTNLAGRMDAWGPDGCEENMAEIVGVMQENANRNGWGKFLPWKEQGAEILVRIAIAKVRANH